MITRALILSSAFVYLTKNINSKGNFRANLIPLHPSKCDVLYSRSGSNSLKIFRVTFSFVLHAYFSNALHDSLRDILGIHWESRKIEVVD